MKKFLALGVVFVAVGCNSGLSEEESQQAFSATQNVLTQGSAHAKSSGQADSMAVSYEHTCMGGGTAMFKGTADDENSANGGTFSYSVTFNNCVSEGVTMDGSVAFKAEVNAGDDSVSLRYSYVGDLDYTGDVDGHCALDVKASLEAGKTGASYSYQGNVCGNEASAALNSKYNFNFK